MKLVNVLIFIGLLLLVSLTLSCELTLVVFGRQR